MQGNIFVTNQMRITFLMLSLPANIYLFKVDNRNTRKRCEICSKLTTRHQKDVIDVEVISQFFLAEGDFAESNICAELFS